MEKILNNYLENKRIIQIITREKQMEGTIESINDGIVHLIGEKYEYHTPIKNILTISSKLNIKHKKQYNKNNPSLGFKLP